MRLQLGTRFPRTAAGAPAGMSIEFGDREIYVHVAGQGRLSLRGGVRRRLAHRCLSCSTNARTDDRPTVLDDVPAVGTLCRPRQRHRTPRR